jgi:hypothetical protein
MTLLAATIGTAFAVLGAVVVATAVLRRRQPDQPPQTVTVLAGLALAVLGTVALSAATLAHDSDSDDEDQATPTSRQGQELPADTAPSTGPPSDPPDTLAPAPDCVDRHLARDPIVRAENRIRLHADVTLPVSPNVATALELADQDDVIGVVRLIHEPVADYVHVYDAVDATCTPIPDATPTNTTDREEDTTRTVLALRMDDVDYTLTIDGVFTGNTFDVTLTPTGD